ncbi:MAG: phosphopentomutase [Erysipelotrichaceae bacterium]|nr:phosphopentomutase [Erysipelotrichaceae bacterium]
MYKKYKRIFLIVLDSVGIGGAIDSKDFGDINVNTVLHTLESTKGSLPNLAKMGLMNLLNNNDLEKSDSYYTRGVCKSLGKDTLTGHLEMMGILTTKPLKTFTETGFPGELIKELENRCGRHVIGNVAASGTEIIKELGEQHMKTGDIIVYTSADSVLQIAAHESIIPVSELYKICEIARNITLKDEWKVGRIIARPFIGEPGNFTRTANRHDFALDPPSPTTLDSLKDHNFDVLAIGKISDIFNNCGITKATKTKDNTDGIEKIKEATKTDFTGLCFANLNDFDSKYGHRRDPIGYMKALKEVDDNINEIKANLQDDDLLIITADHGNDPTYKGTDHTRENTPVIIFNKNFEFPKRLPNLETFGSIGATIADNFNLTQELGSSFLESLK